MATYLRPHISIDSYKKRTKFAIENSDGEMKEKRLSQACEVLCIFAIFVQKTVDEMQISL